MSSVEAGLAKELCELTLTTDEIFQTEFVLLAWRRGATIVELPVRLEERRPATLSIRRRLPMVMNTIFAIRRSLARFPVEGRGTVRTG